MKLTRGLLQGLLAVVAVCAGTSLGCSSSDSSPVPAQLPPEDSGTQDVGSSQEAEPGKDAGPEAAPEAAPEASTEDSADAAESTPVLPKDANETRVSENLKTLSAPSLRGRKSGTADGVATEDWLLDQLTKAGIETKTQEVTFPNHVALGPVSLTLVDESDKVLDTFKYVDDFREVRFTGTGGKAKGELVFAGYGLKTAAIDSYKDIDVTGRLAVVLTGIPSGSGLDPDEDGALDLKVDVAFAHGASGVIMIPTGTDASSDQSDPPAMELWALDKYGEIQASLHHDGFPVVFVHVSQVQRLVGKTFTELKASASFATGRRAEVEIHGVTTPDAKCRNVFGVLPGQDAKLGSEVIILGAHHDHVGVGADGRIFHGAGDNASGTVIVLETALTMKESGAVPKRTALFAFWCGEEDGLHGSLYYTVYGKPLYPLAKTRLMLQFDYIGEKDGPYLTNLDTKEMVVQFVGEEEMAEELPLQGVDWGGQSASDDYGFLYKKVPAYRFLSYGDYHHRTTDTFENASIPMISRVADIAIRGLGAVAY